VEESSRHLRTKPLRTNLSGETAHIFWDGQSETRTRDIPAAQASDRQTLRIEEKTGEESENGRVAAHYARKYAEEISF
jgi:hypothetical protein